MTSPPSTLPRSSPLSYLPKSTSFLALKNWYTISQKPSPVNNSSVKGVDYEPTFPFVVQCWLSWPCAGSHSYCEFITSVWITTSRMLLKSSRPLTFTVFMLTLPWWPLVCVAGTDVSYVANYSTDTHPLHYDQLLSFLINHRLLHRDTDKVWKLHHSMNRDKQIRKSFDMSPFSRIIVVGIPIRSVNFLDINSWSGV